MKWNLRKIAKEMTVGVLTLFVVSQALNYIRKPELTSEKLPSIEGVLIDGTHLELPKGKTLIIHFWGTWCPICKVESPNIQSVSEKYEVLTIAVNSGSDEVIKAYMRERQLNFKVLNDREGKLAKVFDVEVFPTTFIYDANGERKFTEVGYTTTVGLLARIAMVKMN